MLPPSVPTKRALLSKTTRETPVRTYRFSSLETAKEVLRLIEGMKLRNHSTSKGHCKYFVTDAPERFAKLGKRFLGTELEDVKQVEVKFL